MLKVYLDQNKWVDLALAQTGNSRGEKFLAVFKTAQQAVSQGTVSFPISSVHCIENWYSNKHQRRKDIADVMAELSCWDVVARDFQILPTELDNAIKKHFSLTPSEAPIQVFGRGIDHFGLPNQITASLRFFEALPERLASLLPQTNATKFDPMRIVLEGLHQDFSDAGIDNLELRSEPESYAAKENKIAEKIKLLGLSKKRSDDAALASCIVDAGSFLSEALARNGIELERFYGQSPEELRQFVAAVPTLAVTNHLLAFRYKNADLKKSRNDLLDISALRVAVPYCDIVVTEKLWADLLNRKKFSEQFGTKVIHDLNELIQAIAKTERR